MLYDRFGTWLSQLNRIRHFDHQRDRRGKDTRDRNEGKIDRKIKRDKDNKDKQRYRDTKGFKRGQKE
jgi:hypothetical protein